MAPEEEVEARVGVAGEGGVGPEAALELGAERGVAGEHVAGDLLGDVALHVLLALEPRVEEPPRDERVGRARLEEVHGEAPEALADRDKQGPRLEVAPLARPGARDLDLLAPLE